MTNNQACEPCAKRKVRCDHGEPCSNCKRRKTDHCTYPSVSPQERIRQLEALVRELRSSTDRHANGACREPRDRNLDHQPSGSFDDSGLLLLKSLQSQFRGQQINSSTDFPRRDLALPESDGQTGYAERFSEERTKHSQNDASARLKRRQLYSLQERPHALAGMIPQSIVVPHDQFPVADNAVTLWGVFMDRIEPLVRICYRWWLKEFQVTCLDHEAFQRMSGAEYALLSTIYLISVVSMSDKECETLLHQSRSNLISQYESLCGDALIRTNLFCMNDIIVMKAIIFYLMAGYDRLSTQSQESLIGLTIRNAEKLGMHQEGAVFGLNPAQIEDRRRVWWQLQCLEMGAAIRSGSASMTLLANWNTELPLNIEDDDISATSTELPNPRKGLTSMLFSRYFFFVLEKQRQTLYAKRGLPAGPRQSASAVPPTPKGFDVITQFEDSLNAEFLQFIDPIDPMHMLLQIMARFMIATMRIQLLHPLACTSDGRSINNEHRGMMLEKSMQCLQYNNNVQSNPEFQKFRWVTKNWAPFHALACVLIEAAREEDTDRAQEIWNLLSITYAVNTNFWNLSEDRRNYQAAELVVTAWKTWQKRFGSRLQLSSPDFAEKLEKEVVRQRQKMMKGERSSQPQQHSKLQPQSQQQQQSQNYQSENALLTPESLEIVDRDFNVVFDLDFQDLDWSFWSGAD